MTVKLSFYVTNFLMNTLENLEKNIQAKPKHFFLKLSAQSTHPLRQPPQTFHQSGGAREDRTPDPLRAKQVLSQLSYGPI